MASSYHNLIRFFRQKGAVGKHTSGTDVELTARQSRNAAPAPSTPLGFPSFALFMSDNQNSENFVLKRYDRLAARNLLYLQSELAWLQERLEAFDKQDEDDLNLDAMDCARSWEVFERKSKTDPDQVERLKLLLKIREVLKEYHETMIRQSQIAKLETPPKEVLAAVHQVFSRNGSSLVGSSRRIYDQDSANRKDLVQLHSTERKDRVSTFFVRRLLRYVQNKDSAKQAHIDPSITYVHTRRLDLAVDLFYALLSIGLLLGAILSLYFVEDPFWRIGIIVLFTLAFATSSIFLADGRKLAVFGACAAYAAVLVVFVSGNWTPATFNNAHK